MSEARERTISASGSAIELRGIRKRFGAVHAVDGVDLDVAAGDHTVLLGPSGCGKSTLLRLIAGFEPPDDGSIHLFGKSIASVAPEDRGVGIVFQQLALFPHLDVGANIAYGLRRLGRSARKARVDELLQLIGLEGASRRFPDQLSGGQAQRVALARALAPEPQVVLLDEPFSSLDTSLRASLRAEVRSILKAAGVTSVLVTHDQDEALSMGDRIAVMFEGRIVRHGDPRTVYGEPGSGAVAAFVGEANEIDGVVRAGVLTTEIGSLPVAAEDGSVTAIIRPEHVRLEADGAPTDPAVVDVEYYGHDQAVLVKLASGTLIRCRLSSDRVFVPGQRVRLRATAVVTTVPA